MLLPGGCLSILFLPGGYLDFCSEGRIRTADLKGYEPCELTTALPRNIFLLWPWWDLNPYAFRHTPLKRACLPFPTQGHCVYSKTNFWIFTSLLVYMCLSVKSQHEFFYFVRLLFSISKKLCCYCLSKIVIYFWYQNIFLFLVIPTRFERISKT